MMRQPITRPVALPATRDGEAGFQLPELIIATALLAIVMTLVLSLFTSFAGNFTRERAATDSVNIASAGMNEVTRIIRAGTIIERNDVSDLPVFVAAADESITLHSYLADSSLDPAPIRVRLHVNGGRELIIQTWNATRVDGEWHFPDLGVAPDTERRLASLIVAPTTEELTAGARPLFTFLGVDGTRIAAPVATASLGNIATVSVEMVVQADPTGRAAPYRLRNQVGIPNLTDSRMGLTG